MKIFFSLLTVFVSFICFSQETGKIFIKAGTDPRDELTPSRIYRFPVFKKGSVVFRDGTTSQAQLNYNFLNGEIEFVDAKGDTLAIAKAQLPNIKYVQIDSSTFHFKDGYLENILQNKHGKLLQRQVLAVKKREKIGAYNQPTSTSSIESYSSYSFDGQFQFRPDLKIMEDITLEKRTVFYFGDQYNNFLPASKKNLLRTFSKKKDVLNTYLKNNEIDFANYKDLQKLFGFIQTLS